MAKSAKTYHSWTAITVAILLLYFLLLVLPLFSLLLKSIIDPNTGAFTLDYFRRFVSSKYYYGSLYNSLKLSAAVTLSTIIFATPLAYIMTMFRIRGKNIVQVLLLITCMQAPFIGAYSWILLLGRNGVITHFFRNVLNIQIPDIYGFAGILLVFTLQLTPLIYMYLSGAMQKIDASLLEASDLMGYTGIKKVSRIVLPLILPTLLAGSLIVFMRAFSDFGTPMLIGEGYRTVPVLIFNEFISEMGGDDGFAAAISIIVVVFATVIFLIQKYVSHQKSFSMSALNPIEVREAKGLMNIIAHGYVYIFTGTALLPQLYVAYTSFQKTSGRIFVEGYSLQSYATAFRRVGSSIVNTFSLAGISILIVFFLAIIIGYVTVRKQTVITSLLDVITMFPFIVPGSILGIVLLLSFNKRPFLLSGTAAIMIIALVIRRLPFTIRSSAAIMHQISINTEEAAISLGASNTKTFFKVTLPQMLPGVVSGAILSWITIISELSTSILLYTTRTQTMTIAIYTEVIRGNYGVAAALATMLFVITIISLLVFFKVSGKREVTM